MDRGQAAPWQSGRLPFPTALCAAGAGSTTTAWEQQNEPVFPNFHTSDKRADENGPSYAPSKGLTPDLNAQMVALERKLQQASAMRWPPDETHPKPLSASLADKYELVKEKVLTDPICLAILYMPRSIVAKLWIVQCFWIRQHRAKLEGQHRHKNKAADGDYDLEGKLQLLEGGLVLVRSSAGELQCRKVLAATTTCGQAPNWFGLHQNLPILNLRLEGTSEPYLLSNLFDGHLKDFPVAVVNDILCERALLEESGEIKTMQRHAVAAVAQRLGAHLSTLPTISSIQTAKQELLQAGGPTARGSRGYVDSGGRDVRADGGLMTALGSRRSGWPVGGGASPDTPLPTVPDVTQLYKKLRVLLEIERPVKDLFNQVKSLVRLEAGGVHGKAIQRGQMLARTPGLTASTWVPALPMSALPPHLLSMVAPVAPPSGYTRKLSGEPVAGRQGPQLPLTPGLNGIATAGSGSLGHTGNSTRLSQRKSWGAEVALPPHPISAPSAPSLSVSKQDHEPSWATVAFNKPHAGSDKQAAPEWKQVLPGPRHRSPVNASAPEAPPEKKARLLSKEQDSKQPSAAAAQGSIEDPPPVNAGPQLTKPKGIRSVPLQRPTLVNRVASKMADPRPALTPASAPVSAADAKKMAAVKASIAEIKARMNRPASSHAVAGTAGAMPSIQPFTPSVPAAAAVVSSAEDSMEAVNLARKGTSGSGPLVSAPQSSPPWQSSTASLPPHPSTWWTVGTPATAATTGTSAGYNQAAVDALAAAAVAAFTNTSGAAYGPATGSTYAPTYPPQYPQQAYPHMYAPAFPQAYPCAATQPAYPQHPPPLVYQPRHTGSAMSAAYGVAQARYYMAPSYANPSYPTTYGSLYAPGWSQVAHGYEQLSQPYTPGNVEAGAQGFAPSSIAADYASIVSLANQPPEPAPGTASPPHAMEVDLGDHPPGTAGLSVTPAPGVADEWGGSPSGAAAGSVTPAPGSVTPAPGVADERCSYTPGTATRTLSHALGGALGLASAVPGAVCDNTSPPPSTSVNPTRPSAPPPHGDNTATAVTSPAVDKDATTSGALLGTAVGTTCLQAALAVHSTMHGGLAAVTRSHPELAVATTSLAHASTSQGQDVAATHDPGKGPQQVCGLLMSASADDSVLSEEQQPTPRA